MKSIFSRSKVGGLVMLVVLSLALPASVSAQRAVSRGDGGRQSSGGSGGGSSPAPHGGARPSSPRSTPGRAESPPPSRVSGRSTGEADASSRDGSLAGARPRNGDRVIGTAVARSSGPPAGDNTVVVRGHYPYYPYGYYRHGYYPYGYYPYGYYPYYPWAFGVGVGFGYGGFGFGYGGWGYGPWYGYPAYGYPAYGYSGVYVPTSEFPGGVRIRVAPSDAIVYVDGYYAGEVDDFDNTFQQLRLDPGPHKIEVRKDGYEPLNFEVRIQPDQTVTYKGKLKKL